MFRIVDCDNQCYFWGGHWFKNKKEGEKSLKNYHSIDVDNNWLNTMDLNTICAEFNWAIEY